MIRHPRIPAIVGMAATAAIGLGILAATGQFRTTDVAHASLPVLEKKIADGSKDGRVWLAYGDRLREVTHYDMAVRAYQKALEFMPELREARVGQGLALGQAAGGGKEKADAFFEYVERLTSLYPKVAMDLLARSELRPLHADVRWAPAVAAANVQGVD